MPSDVLTISDLQKIISYSPVLETIRNEAYEKEILYRSDPIGREDVVKVRVKQYTDVNSKDKIKEMYNSDKAFRPSSEDVVLGEGCEGVEAYIAFPSVHMYYDGYYVTITAGSGSDNTQKQTLTTAANDAALNLKNLITNNPNPGDNQKSDDKAEDEEKDKDRDDEEKDSGLRIVSGQSSE